MFLENLRRNGQKFSLLGIEQNVGKAMKQERQREHLGNGRSCGYSSEMEWANEAGELPRNQVLCASVYKLFYNEQ